MRKLMVAIAYFSIFAIACSNPYKSKLPGEWKAVKVLEENTPMDIDTKSIWFKFDHQYHYQYHSTLNYHEAGTYYIDSKYLYTTDTVNQATTEKVVEIAKLTSDSLYIKMNDAGKERILILARSK